MLKKSKNYPKVFEIIYVDASQFFDEKLILKGYLNRYTSNQIDLVN